MNITVKPSSYSYVSHDRYSQCGGHPTEGVASSNSSTLSRLSPSSTPSILLPGIMMPGPPCSKPELSTESAQEHVSSARAKSAKPAAAFVVIWVMDTKWYVISSNPYV